MPAKVFEHFEIPPDATGTVKAKCRHCASVISGRVETTSNFISHLKITKTLKYIIIASLVPCVLTLLQKLVMSADLVQCYQNFERKTNISATVRETVHRHCLRQLLWKTKRSRWSEFNITQKNINYVNSLIDSFIHRREKRQANATMRPETGFRVRREYRRLNARARTMFHEAINTLKRNGEYDTFANLHAGIVVTSAHGGPNFFGWHRVYLALFEEALRRINPYVALPYWDSSLDFDLEDPASSQIWSPEFLGNGDGFVTTGPFANWQTPFGPLIRNVGGDSRLISKEVIADILTRCLTAEISEPTAKTRYNLEVAHGGPHLWIGGQMSRLNTAAHDPVFFLHHAFIDYIWEQFRRRQSGVCSVNPEIDYPNATGLHASERPMTGFPQYKATDGYLNFWTRFWYRYEKSPWCSFWRPFCGSSNLQCDLRRRRCVARSRQNDTGTDATGGVRTKITSGNGRIVLETQGRERVFDFGPAFRAPPSDARIRDAIRTAA